MPDPKPDSNTSTPESKGSSTALTFHPGHITLSTFNHLLACYPRTVEQVHRNKLTQKQTSKSKPKPKPNPKRKSADANTTQTQDQDPDPTSTDKQIQADLESFLKLDHWRYDTLPKALAKRQGAEAHLTKDELIDIMAWKTSHGRARPMLMGMIKANQQSTITKATSEAFAALPGLDLIGDGDVERSFPKASLDALTAPLRGVGPATASLVLSIATVGGGGGGGGDVCQVPFYSDDVYLWLVFGVYPSGEGEREGEGEGARLKGVKANGELDVKYNLKEYRGLWDEVQGLRARLGSVSTVEVEKVAYVLRHFALSGYDFVRDAGGDEAVVVDPMVSGRQSKR
ncbi:uncharacterized protein N7511_005362, partial [Penicillium nucicola]|uniref:uncharacterized protein n=1 Tax=Penicillium nucicola TaxID=1850975 RepID=UPI002545968C